MELEKNKEYEKIIDKEFNLIIKKWLTENKKLFYSKNTTAGQKLQYYISEKALETLDLDPLNK